MEGISEKDILHEIPVTELIRIDATIAPVERLKSLTKTLNENNPDYTNKNWLTTRSQVRKNITAAKVKLQQMLDLGSEELNLYTEKLKEVYSRAAREIWKETAYTCVIRKRLQDANAVAEDEKNRRTAYMKQENVLVDVQRFLEVTKNRIPILYKDFDLKETEKEKDARTRDRMEEELVTMRAKVDELNRTLGAVAAQSTPLRQNPTPNRTEEHGGTRRKQKQRVAESDSDSEGERRANRNPQPAESSMSMATLVQALAGENASMAAREKLPVFDGTVANWDSFWQQFTALVDNNPTIPTIIKFNRLSLSLKGPPLRALQKFRFEESSYELVKKALVARFGKPRKVVIEMARQVNNHPQVNEQDLGQLQGFVDLAGQMFYLMRDYEPQSVKYSMTSTMMIEDKLSQRCLLEWDTWCDRYEDRSGEPVPEKKRFELLIEFLGKYVERFRDTLTTNPSIVKQQKSRTETNKSGESRENGGGKPKTSLENFLTVPEAAEQARKREEPTKYKPKCIFCEAEHSSARCKEKPTPEKACAIARKAGVCMNCLRDNHKTKECRSEKCGVEKCTFPHHKSLHIKNYKRKPKEAKPEERVDKPQ
ncbi:Hypothetical predicted protein [Paramuricea clavata]|uniref:Uncharacterized protein n=1 Tax=Paramuricea clavata TaxID=317549 RepID=A0A6S7J2L6_PARCT|nr:Hypothetical predicted protein [Paramuricea clavata]